MANEFFDSLKAEFKPKPLETLTKEVFLSPDLLKNADDGLKNKFISVLLQSLCVSGFVFIAKQSNIDANEKLKYIFNELKKLDRLRILDLQGEVENDFVLAIEKHNKQIKIIAENSPNKTLLDIKADDFIPAVKSYRKSKETFNMLYSSLLSQAQCAWLIDPYFFIDRKEKCGDALNIMLHHLSSKNLKSTLWINCANKSSKYDKKQRKFVDDKIDDTNHHILKKWKNLLFEYKEKYPNVEVKIYAWSGDKSFHDRFLVTNQIGISSGKGFDIEPSADSTFSILPDNMRSAEIGKFYNGNNLKFKLIAMVTADKISNKYEEQK